MKTLGISMVIALGLLVATNLTPAFGQGCGSAAAGGCGAADGGCGAAVAGCGAEANGGGGCDKVCKLVKSEREITAIAYGSRCKDICVTSCGSKCTETECVKAGECSCDGCEVGGVATIRYSTGEPGCANVKSVKQLVKYEVRKTVPVWTWEIVDAEPAAAGCGCEAAGGAAGCGCATASSACGAAAGCGCASVARPVTAPVNVVRRAAEPPVRVSKATARATGASARRGVNVLGNGVRAVVR